MFLIVGDVALEFLFPEGFVAFGCRGVFTAFVPVPEAAVDEDDSLIFRQDDVRPAGQGADVFAEAVSGAVEHGADEDFRLRVLSFNTAHIPRAFRWSQVIHARSIPTCRPKAKV